MNIVLKIKVNIWENINVLLKEDRSLNIINLNIKV